MIRKSLIALSTAAVMATGIAATASTAEAKTHLNIGVYVPGISVGYGDGYWDGDYYGDDCHYEWKAYKKWNKTHTAFKIKHKQVLVCY